MPGNVVPLVRPPGMAQPGAAPAQGGVPNGQLPPPQQPPLPDTDYVGDHPSASEQEDGEPVDVTELRKQFTDYVTIKQAEIAESRTALQYYHGNQLTKEQRDILNARGQPEIIFNRIGRFVNRVTGVLEKLRGDPKAFGRYEDDAHGAELATQCIRYAVDQSRWPPQETEAIRKGACAGIVISEIGLVQGDKGDLDIDVAAVDPTTFFYDPRSLKLDFSDCRFMGVSKLMTQDELEDIFPGKWEEAMGTIDDTGQTLFDQDRYFLWSQGRTKLRLVEHWYRSKGEWRFCFYAGTEILASGVSPIYDHKGKTTSRYDAFAVEIDNDGTHYGFVRNLIGPQDALNQHRMKSVHIMNTRQLVVERSVLGGDTPDIETLRREAARPDGVILYDGDPGRVKFEAQSQEFLQQTQYYQDAKSEIDGFGPNPALASSQSPTDVSGRSLAIQQQTGLAELGSFLASYRGWKLAIYRKIWVQQQKNWTAERTLRVSNDQGAAQYMAVNKATVDPWGRPMLVNAVGQIDVDILIDEGPDATNVMGDVNDTLLALAHNNVPVPPAMIIETSSLPQSKKEKLQAMLSQQPPPDPAAQAAQQATLDGMKAKTALTAAQVQKTQAETGLAMSKAPIEAGKTQADTRKSMADAVHSLALAHGETARTHATHAGTAIDQFRAAREGDAPPDMPGMGDEGEPQPQSGGPPGPPQPPPQVASAAPAQPAPQGQGGPPTPGGLAAALAGQSGAQPGRAQAGMPPQPQPAPQMPPPSGPPWGGVMQGPDGRLYIPDPHNPGQWTFALQSGQQSPGQPPIQGPRLAPDGNHYIFAPHERGNWRKVVRTS